MIVKKFMQLRLINQAEILKNSSSRVFNMQIKITKTSNDTDENKLKNMILQAVKSAKIQVEIFENSMLRLTKFQ